MCREGPAAWWGHEVFWGATQPRLSPRMSRCGRGVQDRPARQRRQAGRQRASYVCVRAGGTGVPGAARASRPVLPGSWRVRPSRPCTSVLTTKYHRPGGFATESYLLMALGAGSPRIRWWQGWFPEAALPGLQSAASSLRPPVVFSLSTCVPAGSLCVLISSSYKDTGQSAHPNGHPNCLPQRPSL